MTRVLPGDLIALEHNGRYYYVFILDRVRLFGGNLAYALHRTSQDCLTADEVMEGPLDGFPEFVDFIFAKRENRIQRLRSKVDVSRWLGQASRFKKTMTLKGKARMWSIFDASFRELKRVAELDEDEKRYPLLHRIDDSIMTDLVDRRWTPEQDERI